MKVSKDEWIRKHDNLVARRSEGTSDSYAVVSNFPTYGEMLSKCFVGKSVLDVGAGAGDLRKFLPEGVEYVGIDAFPYNDSIIEFAIEELDCTRFMGRFDTLIAFAMLDNVQDLELAIRNMQRLAMKNIIILTGVCIPVNEYHTLEIAEDSLDALFNDWKVGHREMIAPKLLLKEYLK
jgi:2-polyprenyl-3-methyl-5-hydroxy-6-metoxy-1,4-benzoquinol methylase